MAPEQNLASDSVPSSSPESKNVFSRLTGIWFSPGETFRSIGRAPDFIVPLILLAVLSTAAGYLMTNRFGREGLEEMTRKQMQTMVDKGFIPQEKVEEIVQQQLPPADGFTAFAIKRGLQGAAFWLVLTLIVAGYLKLVAMLMGAETTFKKVFSVSVYSYLAVAVVSLVIVVTVMYLKNPSDIDITNPVESNLGSLLTMTLGRDALPGILRAFASYIDVFYIWRIALLSIGLAAVSKMKTGTAAMFVGGLFLVFALLGSLATGMFS
ncbi:MAG: YIP1 family protein [Blastocatellia bacterium]